MIYFTKEQFVVGLEMSILSLVKHLSHFSQIPPTFIHLNVIRILMWCNILDGFYQLDLSLLEVLFV